MMPDLTRRNFVKLTGSSALVSGAAVISPTAKSDSHGAAGYQPALVAKVPDVTMGQPAEFNYPDDASPCIALKMGEPVPGGVGPDNDIVAYSRLCSHMGCPVNYDADTATLKCPCHYSIFDPSHTGQQVCGQATQNLPQIELAYNTDDDTIQAIGVIGLIYGRQSNLNE